MDMNEAYVSLDVAKMLKRLGFDWIVKSCYEENGKSYESIAGGMNWNSPSNIGVGNISRPSLTIARSWLKEVKGWTMKVDSGLRGWSLGLPYRCYFISPGGMWLEALSDEPGSCFYFKTYEEALEEGIRRTLMLLLGL